MINVVWSFQDLSIGSYRQKMTKEKIPTFVRATAPIVSLQTLVVQVDQIDYKEHFNQQIPDSRPHL